MPSLTKIAIFCTALAASVHAGYWEFCSQPDRTDCGKAVSTGNKGCLKESGRQSLRNTEFDGSLYFPILIGYSDDNCADEVGCDSVGSDGTELDIDFTRNQRFKFALGAKSFKFVSGSPPQCPNGCTGLCASTKRSRVEAPGYIRGRQQEGGGGGEEEEEEGPGKRQLGGNFWFCDDDDCKTNCGNKIEPNAEGCADGEGNRKSVYFKGTGGTTWQLGAYDNGKCEGAPVTIVHAKKGCNALPSQHDSWQTLGVQAN